VKTSANVTDKLKQSIMINATMLARKQRENYSNVPQLGSTHIFGSDYYRSVSDLGPFECLKEVLIVHIEISTQKITW